MLLALRGALHQAAIKYIGEDAARHIQETFGADVADVAKEAGQDVSKALDKIFDSEGKALIERFSRAQRSIDAFRSQLSTFVASLSGDRKPPLFILIDELDRCRPNYAISLLERMKHLFDIENVVFVLATDTRQLSHAVGAVYGSEFDGVRYLTRFFDRTYSFEAVSRQTFIAHLLNQFPLDREKLALPPNVDTPTFITGAFDYFGLTLRDIEKSYDILRSATSAWDLKVKIEVAVMLPLVIGYQQKLNPALSQDFHAQLEKLAAKNGPPSSLWQIPFRSHRGFRDERVEKVNGINLFRDFCAHSEKQLPDIAGREVTAMYSQWIVQRLSEEFAILYGNSHYPGDPPFSVIRRYPELVRSAGRLLPKKHEPVR